MPLRPTSARWFEIVVADADVGDAVEALARGSEVQFEWTGDRRASDQLETLSEPIARYRALAAEHGRHWPPPRFTKRCCTLPVDVSAQAALRQIERWHSAALPLLTRARALDDQRDLLRRWAPLLAALSQQASRLDLGALAGAGPVLTGACLLLPADAEPLPEPPAPGALVAARCEVRGRRVLFALLNAGDRERLCARVRGSSGECLPIPAWFRGTAADCAAELPFRVTELERELAELDGELRRLADARGLDQAAGVLERIDWFRDTARHIECDGRYCWITGWTSEQDEAAMQNALREAGVNASVDFTTPPADAALPSVMGRARWSRPFGVLTRAVGIPGPTEVDPTAWVALLVPLLFGYMCGDVGHGAVIAAAGLLLRGRLEQWPLLVVCGLAAMGFGVVFGDVFGYGHLLEPLWVHPLDEPLTVLLAPLPFGALVLTVGLLLHAVQSCWQGRGGSEGVADAAQLLVYWGILLAFVDARFLWLLPAGVALCLGNRLWTERSAVALIGGLGHLAERTFTLLLNTLSFTRVGAFALAHAAFETAVVTLGDAAPGVVATIVVIVLGNLVVIVVEGLVVSIQTTRLVLFEFFTRFFEGAGRQFEPARRPPAGGEGESSREGAGGRGLLGRRRGGGRSLRSSGRGSKGR